MLLAITELGAAGNCWGESYIYVEKRHYSLQVLLEEAEALARDCAPVQQAMKAIAFREMVISNLDALDKLGSVIVNRLIACPRD